MFGLRHGVIQSAQQTFRLPPKKSNVVVVVVVVVVTALLLRCFIGCCLEQIPNARHVVHHGQWSRKRDGTSLLVAGVVVAVVGYF